MGIYAVFGALMYNDFASIPSEYPWGSCFNDFESKGTARYADDVQPYNCVSPFGIDSTWHRSEVLIQFTNSFKMKFAVIIAVFHMSLGIIMKALNNHYFGRKIDLLFECVPQILFFWCLFFWMDYLIVQKWLYPWHPTYIKDDPSDNTEHAPAIIQTMLGMVLRFGEIPEN